MQAFVQDPENRQATLHLCATSLQVEASLQVALTLSKLTVNVREIKTLPFSPSLVVDFCVVAGGAERKGDGGNGRADYDARFFFL